MSKLGYVFDHFTKTIICDSEFLKMANNMESNEYMTLVSLRHDWSDYSIAKKKIEKSHSKNTYKHLDIEYMRIHITKMDGENSIHLAELEKMQDQTCRETYRTYPEIKKWFLALYAKTLPVHIPSKEERKEIA